jgi:hypothetical protein
MDVICSRQKKRMITVDVCIKNGVAELGGKQSSEKNCSLLSELKNGGYFQRAFHSTPIYR